MKKANIYKFLYCLSIMLIIGFCIMLIADYLNYDNSNSAPFYAFVIVRCIEFLLTSLTLFIIGKIVKKKCNINDE